MVSFRQFVMISVVCFSFPLMAEIAVEPAESLTLPSSYPSSWIFAHSGDELVILDVAAASHNYKGVLQAAHFANFVESKHRNELYVAETVYSRGTHGVRTDLITIYDKVNISPRAEIILPDNKRGLLIPQKGSFQLTRDEQFALVFNFTPAASVLIVNMDKRQIVNEVPMPGCFMIYPSGERGFSSLCSNGALASFQLDEKGQLIGERVSKSFNDIDVDPLFMKSTTIAGITYFPSFKGRLQAIDMKTDKTKVLKSWSLLDEKDRAESWRPSGLQLISSDSAGRLYVLMRKNAIDGNHELGGEEVWVFDVTTKKRIARIPLKKPGRSIEVTQGEQPYLAVTNTEGVMNVYYGRSGHFIRSINFGGYGGVLHAAK